MSHDLDEPHVRTARSRTVVPRFSSRTAVLAACALGLTLSTVACGGRSRFYHQGVPAPSYQVVTTAELMRYSTAESLYDALASIRPHFLSFRGTLPTVYVNGVRFGDVSWLHEIAVEAVEEVRVLPRSEAMWKYGSASAVLDVQTRGSSE
jgi:hypothetical protein